MITSRRALMSRRQARCMSSLPNGVLNYPTKQEQRLWVQAAQPLAAAACAWMLRSGAWFKGTGGRLVFEYQARVLLLSFSNV